MKSLPDDDAIRRNISAVTLVEPGDLLVVGADEWSHIQILEKAGTGTFTMLADGNVPLVVEETELDIEGLAQDQKYTWVIGSHSMKRKALKSHKALESLRREQRKMGKKLDKSYNRERIETTALEPTREWVYRLKIKTDGEVPRDSILRGSLRDIFANHPVLARFRNIPGKENGIDIEGLAVVPGGDPKEATLLVGLRGPTLRGPLAVVLEVSAKVKKDKDEKKLQFDLRDTHYLPLQGHGIRGMSEMRDKDDGYLLLAGPVGDAPSGYWLYHWNGNDAVVEIDKPEANDNVRQLCRIPAPESAPKAKAEGVQFLRTIDAMVEFVIVYDSAPKGAATVFTCQLAGT